MPAVHYPFIFDFKQPISGNGFLAGVEISGGRALMLQDEDQWWMYGVFPATLSENGGTPNECFLRYMEQLKAILYDFAAEADSYESFNQTVHEFCGQSSADAELWNTAQQKLRAAQGHVQTDQEFIQKLPTQRPEERQPFLRIIRLDKVECRPDFTPNDNVTWTPAMAA
jgi:hypothetical protein